MGSTLIPCEETERASVTSLFTIHTDFKEGISFYDIFPLFNSPSAVSTLLKNLVALVRGSNLRDCTVVIGLESRGFLLGALLADHLGVGFAPVRKAGKLPGACVTLDYSLEYGHQSFQMQKNHGYPQGTRALLVDDLLATGGEARRGDRQT